MSVLCMRGTMEGVLLHEEGSQRVPGSTCPCWPGGDCAPSL